MKVEKFEAGNFPLSFHFELKSLRIVLNCTSWNPLQSLQQTL